MATLTEIRENPFVRGPWNSPKPHIRRLWSVWSFRYVVTGTVRGCICVASGKSVEDALAQFYKLDTQEEKQWPFSESKS